MNALKLITATVEPGGPAMIALALIQATVEPGQATSWPASVLRAKLVECREAPGGLVHLWYSATYNVTVSLWQRAGLGFMFYSGHGSPNDFMFSAASEEQARSFAHALVAAAKEIVRLNRAHTPINAPDTVSRMLKTAGFKITFSDRDSVRDWAIWLQAQGYKTITATVEPQEAPADYTTAVNATRRGLKSLGLLPTGKDFESYESTALGEFHGVQVPWVQVDREHATLVVRVLEFHKKLQLVVRMPYSTDIMLCNEPWSQIPTVFKWLHTLTAAIRGERYGDAANLVVRYGYKGQYLERQLKMLDAQ